MSSRTDADVSSIDLPVTSIVGQPMRAYIRFDDSGKYLSWSGLTGIS